MYLALKWLVLMAVAMWVILCCFDLYINRHAEIVSNIVNDTYEKSKVFYKNLTTGKEPAKTENVPSNSKRQGMTLVHYIALFGGALAMYVYNKKNSVKILYMKIKTNELNIKIKKEHLQQIATELSVNLLKKLKIILKILIQFMIEKGSMIGEFTWKNVLVFVTMCKKYWNTKTLPKESLNDLLLQRLRDIVLENADLAQLLTAALKENKHIRTQHELETRARDRLLDHIKNGQKQIKEYRSRCMNFQQLYVVTHQENLFLKTRLQNNIKEKKEVEKMFMALFSRAYSSSDLALKEYCNHFVEQNEENLANSDLSKQILRFVQRVRCRPLSMTSSLLQMRERVSINLKDIKSQASPTGLSDVSLGDKKNSKESIPSFATESPKPRLRGLPGECVWTVKDKDGIIEKLYEYDYGCDHDKGDTIRRIREYTVYHDKDCLLDFANSRSTTVIYRRPHSALHTLTTKNSMRCLANRKFLTDSEVFQKFLESNSQATLPAPPVLCG